MAILQTSPSGRPGVTIERHLTHPPEKVWHAITTPEELAHWFPAAVTLPERPAAGGKITFTFTETGDTSEGEILAYQPPGLFEFSWNTDVIRIEVSAERTGSKLEFTHTFNRGEPEIALIAAGRHTTGWVACLESLDAALDGRTPVLPTDWHARMLHYIEEWGLEYGEILKSEILNGGKEFRFRRDLVWPAPADVWQRLLEFAGDAEVLESRSPEVLEYTDHGRVRWEVTADPLDGVRVELRQTVPADLADQLPDLMATRHEQLNALFAASFDLALDPWSAERVASTRKQYEASRG
ncbi:SRPBCC domain-containing protein [Amycolatopsis jejuensis]|uniref:SRPBCC domain-containing protein n=1 Tax=Amycolatopsis jejuensis TaxID=330084 RepID=UPI000525D06B|nr:SRPBCC domain-containing protein [Amycolatopsis jejuensis]